MLRIAKTENGTVRGLPAADPRITSFKGVPFAKPPVGPLRFHAPVPPENWEGVKDCYSFGPIPMQSIPGLDRENIYTGEWNVDPEIPMSEDCLYLNIWTPAKSPEEKLPVYVWFYGGALQWGNTAEMEFDGERLARRGIVVVTVSYRLNVFGFLAHKELTREAPEAPANFGHLDQRQGLLWTKRNIAAFGGNPDAITIGGQSAGGASVLAQLNCPDNVELIRGAIVQSGIFHFPDPSYGFTGMGNLLKPQFLEEAEQKGEAFFRFLGVDSLEEARLLPAEVIRDHNDVYGQFWGTVIDNCFQKQTCWEGIEAGKLLQVPVLTGYTNAEFMLQNKELEELPIIELGVRVWSRYNEKNSLKAPMFVYEFGAEIPGEDHPGAFHSSDLWFCFETLAKCHRPFTGKHYDLARQMCNYWASFIQTGVPKGNDPWERDVNGKSQPGIPMPDWQPFTEENPNIMTFFDRCQSETKPANGLIQKILSTSLI